MVKTLIYIMGAGRSGTTLLDIMLGNNSKSISLGEVNRFYKREGVPPKRSQKTETFQFWKIFKDKQEHIKNYDYQTLNITFHRNEYHTAVFKALLKKNSPLYKDSLCEQYKILKDLIKEDILIESSKYPVRALNLSNYLNPIDFQIKYIYLKKDPVSVVNSFRKKDLEQPGKNFFTANLYYLVVNLLCYFTALILRKRGHSVIRLTYESLLTDKENSLLKIQSKLGVDQSELIAKVKQSQPLKTGFLFDGNRIRLQETLTLRNLEQKNNKNFRYYFIRIFNYLVYR